MSYDPYRGHAPPPPQQPYAQPQPAPREDRSNTLVRIVRLVTGIATSVFLLHIVFVVLDANQANEFVGLVYDLATALVLGLGDVFTPDDPTLWVVLNYGFAALVYLVIGNVIVRALRRP